MSILSDCDRGMNERSRAPDVACSSRAVVLYWGVWWRGNRGKNRLIHSRSVYVAVHVIAHACGVLKKKIFFLYYRVYHGSASAYQVVALAETVNQP